MPKYLLITHIPVRQGFLGPIPEKNLIEEAEEDNIEMLRRKLHIPLDGKVYVADVEDVTVIESGLVNKIVEA